MLIKTRSWSVLGLDVRPVDVEVNSAKGIPGMVIVGLPGKAIMESRDRVKTALANCYMPMPRSKLTVNLAPGDLPKEGPLYDLPIACATLACQGVFKPSTDWKRYTMVGELALDGSLRPVHGILPMAKASRDAGCILLLPAQNLSEASLVKDLEIVPLRSLKDAMDFFQNKIAISELTDIAQRENTTVDLSANRPHLKDFSEVVGQAQAKRALCIAAAGRHNVLMLGPPGSGKSMLAERVPSILPPLSLEEALEVTNIYSVTGMLNPKHPLIEQRPCRAPHHTISEVALIGGGSDSRPGEVSLAHRGVLFLDEFPEFKRSTLEVMRQPLENGCIQIARAKRVCNYPARYMLIAAMNPCPCGYNGSTLRSCRCSDQQIERYLSKLSGPLLDRIDIHLEVTDQSPELLRRGRKKETPSSEMRQQVDQALSIQQHRYRESSILANGELRGAMIERHCPLDREAENLLLEGMRQMGLSTRAYHKVLAVSRTIADLEACAQIRSDHIAEAMGYRLLDRRLFG